MKPRLLFIGIICVLMYGWYQIAILPYTSNVTTHLPDENASLHSAMDATDSSVHASAQGVPGVW